MAMTAKEFLNEYGHLFKKEGGALYVLAKPITIQESEFSDYTNGIAQSFAQLEKIVSDGDEEAIAELQNALMGNIVGWGGDFQGSYPESDESDDFTWNLDWGSIELDKKTKTLRYSDIRFYEE